MAALLLATADCTAVRGPRALVGEALPEAGQGEWRGWRERERWAIEEEPSSGGETWGWVVWTRPGEGALFLRGGGRVADVVRLELVDAWELGTNCSAAGSSRWTRDIVGVVPAREEPQGPRCPARMARAAWRIDRGRGRIESVPVEGLSCRPPCPWD